MCIINTNITFLTILVKSEAGSVFVGNESMLDAFTVVLCRVEGAANVGACCRAMKTMGFSKLAMAECPGFDKDIIKTHALHAYDIYENAKFYPGLKESSADFSMLAGFTRRQGSKRQDGMELASFSAWLGQNFFVNEAGAETKTALPGFKPAIVFGNEKSGLTNEELGICDEAVFISSSAAFPSLNLSHAVQLACWELRKALVIYNRPGCYALDKKPEELPGRHKTDEAAEFIMNSLAEMGLYKLGGRAETEALLRRLLSRSAMSENELAHVKALFLKILGVFTGRRLSGDGSE